MEIEMEDTVQIFQDADESYIKWCKEHPDGYVLNRDKNGLGKKGLYERSTKLHSTQCTTINGQSSDYEKGSLTHDYIKICSNTREGIDEYLQKNDLNFENVECGTCKRRFPNFSHPTDKDIKNVLSDSDSFVFKSNNISKQGAYKKQGAEVKPEDRHAQIQEKLALRLKEKFGEENVSVENSLRNERIDVVLKEGKEFTFYEIKTANDALLCIRQAIGQLLEYAYYPNAENAKKLVIVSKHQLDENAEKYLNFLKAKFGLPLDYQQVTID
jgi:hypothetical protein